MCCSVRTMQPRFLRDPEMSMLCSLVDIVPANSSADHAAMWSQDAINAFASMIGDRAILLTVCYLALCVLPKASITGATPVM